MSATPSESQWLHRMAVLTACAALLPITVGALVTTMNWGMAFADWPTSDGHNMFFYPWLRDFRANPGKFTEHGHRLGGAFIGLCSIALAVVACRRDRLPINDGRSRATERRLALAILLGVVLQGLLGGSRVLRDDPRMAMAHGAFASIVFSMMCLLALITSRRWRVDLAAERTSEGVVSEGARNFLLAAPFVVLMQYLLGGSIRHLGLSLHEHLGGAILVAGCCGIAAIAAWRSRVVTVRRLGRLLSLALLTQLCLGAGAWITRFGFARWGIVAVQQSPQQVLFRTSHTVAGMFVLATSALLAYAVVRLDRVQVRENLAPNASLARGGV